MSTASTTLSAPGLVAASPTRRLALVPALLAHIALAALILFAFREPLTRPGRIVAGHDMTQSFNWEVFNRSALAQGTLPWWNPYTLSGVPSLADIQTQLAYPLNLPLRLLPIQLFFNWGLVLHFWLAGAGVMALCRVIGTSWIAAFLAGAGFALGGVYAPRVDAGQVTVIYGWSWLPMALALAVVSVRRTTWLPHPALPIVLTFVFLAGHIQTSIYVYAAVGAFFVYAWIAPGRIWSMARLRWHVAAQWCVVLMLLAGLAAVMLLPNLTLVQELGRTAGLTYEAATRNSWDILHLLTLYAPDAMSSIRAEPNDSVTGSHWERSAYSGALLALLVPFGLTLDRRFRWYAAFLGSVALLALLFAFGRNLPFYYLHYLVLPGLRHAARVLPLMSLGIVVLGAFGLDALLRNKASMILGLSILATEATGIGILLWLLQMDSGATIVQILGHAMWMLPVLFAGLAALILLQRAPHGLPIAAVTVLSLELVVELSLYAHPFIQAERLPEFRAVGPLLGREHIDRVATNCDLVIQPNDMMQLGIPTVNGYNSVFFQGYAALTFLTMQDQIPIGTKQVRGITVDSTSPDRVPQRMDLLNMMNVTHVLTCGPLKLAGFVEVENRGSSALYRNLDAWPRAVLTCGFEVVPDQDEAIKRVRDTSLDLRERTVVQTEGQQSPPVSLQAEDGCREGARVDIPIKDRPDGEVIANVTAPQGGILFLSEPYYPERRAWLDGVAVPFYRADIAYTAAAVPPGEHTLELRYEPRSFMIGGVISAIAAVCWVVLLMFWRRSPVSAELLTRL